MAKSSEGSKKKPSPKAKPSKVTKKKPTTPKKVAPTPEPTPLPQIPEPKLYPDQLAEGAYTTLPGRLESSFVLVEYTGRKRVYLHYGRTGTGDAFWYLIRSDGPKLLKVFPDVLVTECFSELVEMLEHWQSGVNPDPMSASYCDISPDIQEVVATIRNNYLG